MAEMRSSFSLVHHQIHPHGLRGPSFLCRPDPQRGRALGVKNGHHHLVAGPVCPTGHHDPILAPHVGLYQRIYLRVRVLGSRGWRSKCLLHNRGGSSGEQGILSDGGGHDRLYRLGLYLGGHRVRTVSNVRTSFGAARERKLTK